MGCIGVPTSRRTEIPSEGFAGVFRGSFTATKAHSNRKLGFTLTLASGSKVKPKAPSDIATNTSPESVAQSKGVQGSGVAVPCRPAKPT
jgi:hypothetical protein